MATLKVRLAARDAFLAKLAEAARHRDDSQELVPGLYGSQDPAWVVYEAEQMLALVNELRAEEGLPAATLDQVRRIEQSASGHCDYADKYALRCAFLALGEEG
ncbi:hypothetical protein AB0F17_08525 [Nonomuraea sp. NPDC026600]|uniref:hypothetical protein n=1 Tax=Nonomuraea sp. NPDC026600 TaxID=3155363 RepID=UPI0033C8FFD4